MSADENPNTSSEDGRWLRITCEFSVTEEASVHSGGGNQNSKPGHPKLISKSVLHLGTLATVKDKLWGTTLVPLPLDPELPAARTQLCLLSASPPLHPCKVEFFLGGSEGPSEL